MLHLLPRLFGSHGAPHSSDQSPAYKSFTKKKLQHQKTQQQKNISTHWNAEKQNYNP